ncbi:hypothetical protein [Terriglobus saanensis]|nr:hypothetical protein [Terriglobus saanensis]
MIRSLELAQLGEATAFYDFHGLDGVTLPDAAAFFEGCVRRLEDLLMTRGPMISIMFPAYEPLILGLTLACTALVLRFPHRGRSVSH